VEELIDWLVERVADRRSRGDDFGLESLKNVVYVRALLYTAESTNLGEFETFPAGCIRSYESLYDLRQKIFTVIGAHGLEKV
jgi:hypothetical protein